MPAHGLDVLEPERLERRRRVGQANRDASRRASRLDTGRIIGIPDIACPRSVRQDLARPRQARAGDVERTAAAVAVSFRVEMACRAGLDCAVHVERSCHRQLEHSRTMRTVGTGVPFFAGLLRREDRAVRLRVTYCAALSPVNPRMVRQPDPQSARQCGDQAALVTIGIAVPLSHSHVHVAQNRDLRIRIGVRRGPVTQGTQPRTGRDDHVPRNRIGNQRLKPPAFLEVVRPVRARRNLERTSSIGYAAAVV